VQLLTSTESPVINSC